MRRVLKWARIGVLVALVGAQFLRPDRTNPPIDAAAQIGAHLEVPADVESLLGRACVDCHTRSTVWPWYSNVAPLSWFVAGHVTRGREYLDLDQWSQYSDYDAQNLLEEIAEEVVEKKMPLPSYLRMHPEAELLDHDRRRIAAWARSERDRILARLGSSERTRDNR